MTDRSSANDQQRPPSPRENGAGWPEAAAAIRASASSIPRFLSGLRRVQPAREGSAKSLTASATSRPEDLTGGLIEEVRPTVRSTAPQLVPGTRVIGYITVADDDPVLDEGLDVIDALCGRAGWILLETVRDLENGPRALQRPGLSYALKKLDAGDADVLVISNARRLSRSIVDLGTLMAWFDNTQATLIALDLDVDTSTSEGQRVATVLATLGAWERERIARRTRIGLEAVKSRGGSVGRPAIKDQPGLTERITEMRAGGMTLQAIADTLNAEAVPTVRGGALWRPSSVQTALGYRRPRGRLPHARLPHQRHGAGGER
jgi:DNA invertase Pin-like site-specific DNA recombinase